MPSAPEAAAYTKQYGQCYSKALKKKKKGFMRKGLINYFKDAKVTLDFKC